MSKKQKLYTELLRLSAPATRNVLTRSFVFGRARLEAYELNQLTHDLYISILDEEFIDHDFWILNVHAKSYFERAKNTNSYDIINRVIRDLFLEVPDSLKHKLEWNGP